MVGGPTGTTPLDSSAASDVDKRQALAPAVVVGLAEGIAEPATEPTGRPLVQLGDCLLYPSPSPRDS